MPLHSLQSGAALHVPGYCQSGDPGAVGAGTFWTGMVDYVSGVSVDRVLDEIEDSWPD